MAAAETGQAYEELLRRAQHDDSQNSHPLAESPLTPFNQFSGGTSLHVTGNRKGGRLQGCLVVIAVLFVFGLALALVAPDEPAASTDARTNDSPAAPHATATHTQSAVDSMSAIEQMELAFVGNPRQSTIKSQLERAMDLYGLPKTESNYSRAGSVLVVLRQETGETEVDILDYMIRSHVPGVNVSFHDAAALAATFLAAGDR